MFKYQTDRRLKYYDQVIEIYKQTGYSAGRIEKMRVVPVSRHAIRDWINNFVSENGKVNHQFPTVNMVKPQTTVPPSDQSEEMEALRKRVKELEAQLLQAEIRAEFYDEMINVAEAKFRIPIRKKAGAKQ